MDGYQHCSECSLRWYIDLVSIGLVFWLCRFIFLNLRADCQLVVKAEISFTAFFCSYVHIVLH